MFARGMTFPGHCVFNSRVEFECNRHSIRMVIFLTGGQVMDEISLKYVVLIKRFQLNPRQRMYLTSTDAALIADWYKMPPIDLY